MDEDRSEADAGEENQIPNHGGFQFVRFHRGAAVFDDDCLSAELLDVREGFGEDLDPELVRGEGLEVGGGSIGDG